MRDRIVINAVQLLSTRMGVGNYAYRVATMAPRIDTASDYRYYCRTFSKRLPVLEGLGSVRSAKEKVKSIAVLGRAARAGLDILAKMPHREFDLYFEPSNIPLPNIRARKIVATVHDFSSHLYPEFHPEDRVEIFRKNFWTNISRADAIITVSDYIKGEAMEFLGVGGDKVKVIHHGVDRAVFRQYEKGSRDGLRGSLGLPENFILCVGAIEPRKNILRLLEAYKSLGERVRKEIKLVMVGDKGWRSEDIYAAMDSLKGDLVYLGYVRDVELAEIYNLARFLVYPSLYEGFGFPPLEAMACGCPVVVSRAASLPEVCGDAALYVDPLRVESIAEGLERAIEDAGLREGLSRKGLVRAETFSWDRSVKQHVELFHDVIGR